MRAIQMTDSPTTVFTSASTQTSLYAGISTLKRKRKPAGTPDPDAEVIALSPQTLMESDRYICEICNQGFQRDQNLQMHRRRHKVPWKLLKRLDPEVRKRVYICPEPSCLHHNPCHALGDLVGIKKHYRRKHSCMKQWECEKCSKAYAVQSDYKAHMKTCGTRGHSCNCGRVFSRVESFIEHQDTCPAARNKKGNASTGLEGASLPSLVEPAAAAALMSTTTSLFSGKIIKQHSHHHNAASIHFHPSRTLYANDHHHSSLLPQISPSLTPSPSAIAMNAHACSMIPSPAAPSQLINASSPSLISAVNVAVMQPRHTSLGMEATQHSQAAQDGSMAYRQASQHPCIPQYNNLVSQNHKAELQLLPAASKLHLNQLESSEGSVTLGKDITSANSTTSGRTCCSPGLKEVDDKHAHKAGDCPRMLHLRGAASSSVDAAPCKLQLSIGLSNNDDFAYSENQQSMHKARGVVANYQEENSKSFHSKGVSMPWLHWDELQGKVTQKNDTCRDNSIETPKSYSSLCSTTGAKQGIVSSTDANNDTVDLELASSMQWLHQQVAATTLCSSNVYHNLKLEENLDRFVDQTSTTRSRRMQYEEVLELLQATKRSSQRASKSLQGAEKAKLLHCNSTRDSITRLDVSNQQQTEKICASLSGSIEETDRVSEVLQYTETPSFSLGTNGAKLTDFSRYLDMKAPASDMQAALEALVEEAREKLKRASEEKLEAEKAWIEARREREQAEEERAKVLRIAEYNRMVALGDEKQEEVGAKFGKPTCSSSTIRSSPSFNSLANCHGSSSSFQVMQLQEGSVSCTAAPSFVTCPSCHHTSQILYPPPNRTMGSSAL